MVSGPGRYSARPYRYDLTHRNPPPLTSHRRDHNQSAATLNVNISDQPIITAVHMSFAGSFAQALGNFDYSQAGSAGDYYFT